MNHTNDILMLIKKLHNFISITQVKFIKSWCFVCDFLNSIKDEFLRITQVINDNHFVALLNELDCCMRANVTSTTSYQYFSFFRFVSVSDFLYFFNIIHMVNYDTQDKIILHIFILHISFFNQVNGHLYIVDII